VKRVRQRCSAFLKHRRSRACDGIFGGASFPAKFARDLQPIPLARRTLLADSNFPPPLRGARRIMEESMSPAARPSILEEGRQVSDPFSFVSETDGANSGHIQLAAEPQRPQLPKRNTVRGESTKSISEALRLARSREEQETLLGEEEQADDDGCYPPRQNDEPRTPNPHRHLPIYTTIHKVRRLVIASIGMPCPSACGGKR